MDELESKALRLSKELADFGAELKLAYAYTTVDPASSLTKSRIVMEKLLLDVYTQEMGHEPRKPMLGDMLADNQFTRKLERRILSRMNSIREMANLGPHGEAVEASDAARVLDDLCSVLDWYLERMARLRPPPAADQNVDAPAERASRPEAAPAPAVAAKARAQAVPRGCVVTVSIAFALLLLVTGPLFFQSRTGPAPTGSTPPVMPNPHGNPADPPKGTPGIPGAADDLHALQGGWRTVSVEFGGEAVTPLYDRMTIADHTLSFFHSDGKPGSRFTIELDESARPKRIDLRIPDKNVDSEGIYALDGDTLTVCTAESPHGGAKEARPSELATRPGSSYLLVKYKRE